MSEWIPTTSTLRATDNNIVKGILVSSTVSVSPNTLAYTTTHIPSVTNRTISKDEDFLHSHIKLVLGIGLPLVILFLAILGFYVVAYVRRRLRQRRFLRELLPDYGYDQSEAVFDGYTQYSDTSSVDLLVPKNKVYWLPDQIGASEPNLALLPDSPEPNDAGSEELLQSIPV